jgi:predicted transcriptional regulator
MGHEEWTATNPLTDEKRTVREAVSEIIGSDRLQVLNILDESSTPISQSSILQSAAMSQTTLSSHLGELEDRGYVERNRHGVKLTAGGTLLQQCVEYGIDEIGEDKLAFLTRSKFPIQFLRTINESPTGLSELGEGPDTLSRPQIGQIFDSFAENGWCREDWGGNGSSRYYTTDSGGNVLDVFDTMVEAVEQLIQKAPWFLRLPTADGKLSIKEIRALTDAELVVSGPTNHARVLWEALNFLDMRIDRVRALGSVYNQTLIHSYMKILNYGVEFEAIVDSATHSQIRENEETQYVLDNSRHPHYDLFYLDQPQTLGIGIYDDRKIAIGAYNETGRGNQIAMIHSSNDDLVEFGESLYDSYREKAQRPSPPPSDYPSPPSLFEINPFENI